MMPGRYEKGFSDLGSTRREKGDDRLRLPHKTLTVSFPIVRKGSFRNRNKRGQGIKGDGDGEMVG